MGEVKKPELKKVCPRTVLIGLRECVLNLANNNSVIVKAVTLACARGLIFLTEPRIELFILADCLLCTQN